jgi:hypothetical protein
MNMLEDKDIIRKVDTFNELYDNTFIKLRFIFKPRYLNESIFYSNDNMSAWISPKTNESCTIMYINNNEKFESVFIEDINDKIDEIYDIIKNIITLGVKFNYEYISGLIKNNTLIALPDGMISGGILYKIIYCDKDSMTLENVADVTHRTLSTDDIIKNVYCKYEYIRKYVNKMNYTDQTVILLNHLFNTIRIADKSNLDKITETKKIIPYRYLGINQIYKYDCKLYTIKNITPTSIYLNSIFDCSRNITHESANELIPIINENNENCCYIIPENTTIFKKINETFIVKLRSYYIYVNNSDIPNESFYFEKYGKRIFPNDILEIYEVKDLTDVVTQISDLEKDIIYSLMNCYYD